MNLKSWYNYVFNMKYLDAFLIWSWINIRLLEIKIYFVIIKDTFQFSVKKILYFVNFI